MELTNAAGCLTSAGLKAVAEAPPGGAPAELAAHLAACTGCQRRLLNVDRTAAPPARRAPSPRRFALLVLALLLGLAALLWTTRIALS